LVDEFILGKFRQLKDKMREELYELYIQKIKHGLK